MAATQVVCTSATQAAIDKARSAGRCLWRVSSTVFSHVASDVELVPLGGFLSKASEVCHGAAARAGMPGLSGERECTGAATGLRRLGLTPLCAHLWWFVILCR